MNVATRKTRACTIEALDEDLKAAIRAHGQTFGLEDMESDILMCCETITVHQKKGLLGGLTTTLSAVYVTPKWLVWADSHGRNDVAAGAAPLSQINLRNDRAAAPYAMTPDQGLNITGRKANRNETNVTFIVLEAKADGEKFRQILHEAWNKVAK